MAHFPWFFFSSRLWIKGKEFSIKNLLQNQDLANYFKDGSLAVFRLAPQDYHRYHSPVDGELGEYVDIPGTYYTVNPMAIRERVTINSLSAINAFLIFLCFISFVPLLVNCRRLMSSQRTRGFSR